MQCGIAYVLRDTTPMSRSGLSRRPDGGLGCRPASATKGVRRRSIREARRPRPSGADRSRQPLASALREPRMFATDEGGAVPVSADHPDHPVARVLRERRDSGSRPGQRRDPYRVVLAVEGGGMRGIISGAMLTALADMSLQQSFDAVYALSAGAINVTYFIAGSTWQALSVYYDELVGRNFFDPRRMLFGQPIVSIPYVFD